ncbi:MAG: S9 family peptidase [Marinilabiliales bacterium]|nr:S9 family peptidase [Marinilabiliales bacterium]
MPISVKARDGKTDLYGMMFRPTNFDPSKKYPIINHAYPGPAVGQRRAAARFAAARGDKQALAELGFVVVSIDGMGTPGRSKSFHDAYYGAMGRDNTLPDQVAGMKELAQRYPVDRHRPRGDVGPLGRRVHRRRRDVPLPRLLQGRHLGVGQPRPARLRGRLGRALPGPAREERRRAATTTRPRRTRPSRRT